MTNLVIAWLPLATALIAFAGVMWFLGKRQMKDYGAHVDRVESINDELVALTQQLTTATKRNSELLEEIRDALLQSGKRK